MARSLGEADMTPLHWAARAEMLWLLAGAGADLNAQDRKDRTPLHQAMYGGQPRGGGSPDRARSRRAHPQPTGKDAAGGGAQGLFVLQAGISE